MQRTVVQSARVRWFCRVAVVLLLLPTTASAQTASGSSFTGAVKDADGGALVGVTVEVESPALIERVRVATTGDRGQYRITDLGPGTYSVTFTLPGFRVVRHEGIQLTANFAATVNAELAIGTIAETVTVTGEGPVVDIHNVTQQRTLSREALDLLPANKNAVGYANLTAAAVMPPNSMDVAGNTGELSVRLSIHGTHQSDQKQLFDGMRFNSMLNTGTSRNFYPNHASVEEVVVETGSGGSGEFSSGGVQLNVVPKDGGNRFSGTFLANYTGDRFQDDNLSSELVDRGVVLNSSIEDIYDLNGALGGPLKRDRLWFYSAIRRWGNTTRGANLFENADLSAWLYSPNLAQPASAVEWYNSANARLTWQAAKAHKISFFWDHQHSCLCNSVSGSNALFSGNNALEATNGIEYTPVDLVQSRWLNPASDRLLFTAGVSYFNVRARYTALPEIDPTTAISVLDQTRGFRYRAPVSTRNTRQRQSNQQFSVSYFTGNHSLKAGLYMLEGFVDSDIMPTGNGVSYGFLNNVPAQLTQTKRTVTHEVVNPELGLFVQDQWILDRLTLNVGLRFEYFRAYNGAVEQPAGPFNDAHIFGEVDCVPCWKDLTPRIAAAFDLLGNGKTVVKASLGRYVGAQATGLADANNPVNASVNATNRAWSDTNGNRVPDCDLRNPGLNGECGPMANANFGQLNIRTRYDPEVLTGWGSRDYNWQASATVEHELRPGTSVSAGYFRTWYGNFTVTDNLAVTPDDYQPYCFTAPADDRLEASGSQICGLYDIVTTKFGQVNNLVTFASNYGKQSEIYNGFDLNLNTRLPKGAFVTAGMSIGNSISAGSSSTASSKRCFVVDSPQELYQCDRPVPYRTQVKMSATYPLPWNFQASVVFQTLPGTPIDAIYAVPTASIAPSLGRPLAGGARTASVNLTQPYTQFEGRISQLDVRLLKSMRVRQLRVKGMVDLYNALNASPVLQLVNAFGPTWQRPSQILNARTVKFGVQMDF
ncbi:MAG: carboxypeptidase regulatory-like domain-containing protein [Vicinamibacterales bacterium]